MVGHLALYPTVIKLHRRRRLSRGGLLNGNRRPLGCRACRRCTSLLIELQPLQPLPQLPQPSTSSASSNSEVAEPADKHVDEICAACNAEDPPHGKIKSARVPWVGCDLCPRWFHRVCVGVSMRARVSSYVCDICIL